MKFTTWAKGLAASSLLAVAVLLSGCSGGGGSSVPPELQGLTASAVEGNIQQSPGAHGNSTSTHFYLRFGVDSSNHIVGSANFDVQTNGVSTFAYTADINNFQRTGTTSGNISFDMNNFSSGAPYQALHWTGNYTWNGQTGTGSVFSVSNGSITGTDSGGNTISTLGFSFNLLANAPDTNFGGPWHGQFTVEGIGAVDWTGQFTREDELNTSAAITVNTTTVTVAGRTTFDTFAGTFDAAIINPLLTGQTGIFFVRSEVGSTTMAGSIFIIDADGNLLVTGTVTGTKGTGGGGGGTFSAGYYEGTITLANQTLPLHLDAITTNLSPGAQGAAAILEPNGVENDGFRVNQVDTNSSHTQIVLSNGVGNHYTNIVLDGTVSNGVLSGEVLATQIGGATRTGTFTISAAALGTRYDLSGDWSGTLTGQSGTPNSVSGQFFQTGDELTISTSNTFFGFTVPYVINAYVVKNTMVGDFNQTITNPIPGSFNGHFDGTVNSATSVTGEFNYSAQATGLGTTSDNGTFSFTKN